MRHAVRVDLVIVALVRHEAAGSLRRTHVSHTGEYVLQGRHRSRGDEKVGVGADADVRCRIMRVRHRGAFEHECPYACRAQPGKDRRELRVPHAVGEDGITFGPLKRCDEVRRPIVERAGGSQRPAGQQKHSML